MDLSVRRSAPHLLHALGIVALVISAALGATACAGVMTTGSLVKNAKASITEQSGVHLVTIAKSSSSSSTEKIIADFGTKSGVENISEGKADSVIKVMPTYAYISGNSSGLTTIFGLSSADANKIGKDWVSWKAGTSQYSGFKSGSTISSITAVVSKAEGAKLSTDVTKGAKLYVLMWMTAATSSLPKVSNTLTVSAQTNLPVEETASTSGGAKETTTFSKWDEHVVVNAPPVASTITASGL
jgi:hypothetical protein